ncbi:MAG: protein phosphatase 2C domain-containing protein [Gammaproteobacteria bacterium]
MIELNGRLAVEQIPGDRDYQEDDYGVIDGRALGFDGTEHTVLVLADGMGGHSGGNTASAIVVREFIESYQKKDGLVTDRLRESLDDANAGIASAISGDPKLAGMGSTLVAAVVSSKGLEWVSVGDSPLWLYRKGQLRRLNADHSMAPVLNDMVETGLISPEDAQSDSKRHGLRSAVCGDRMKYVDVSSQPVALQTSDRILVASDGILTLSEDEITDCFEDLGQNAEPADAVARLLQAVQEAGLPGQDNTTIMVLKPERNTGLVVAIPAAEDPVSSGQFHVEAPSRLRPLVAGVVLAIVIAFSAAYLIKSWSPRPEEAAAVEPETPTVTVQPAAVAPSLSDPTAQAPAAMPSPAPAASPAAGSAPGGTVATPSEPPNAVTERPATGTESAPLPGASAVVTAPRTDPPSGNPPGKQDSKAAFDARLLSKKSGTMADAVKSPDPTSTKPSGDTRAATDLKARKSETGDAVKDR